MSTSDELLKWHQLRQSGAISEEEFEAAKARLLSQAEVRDRPAPLSTFLNPQDVDAAARQWGLLLHLSQFLGAVVPFAGLVVPIVIWQLKKDEYPVVDEHGRVVMNWILSMFIYLAAGILLTFILIGIPLLFALGLAALIFPIVGAVKANNGEVWPYPLSIKFF